MCVYVVQLYASNEHNIVGGGHACMHACNCGGTNKPPQLTDLNWSNLGSSIPTEEAGGRRGWNVVSYLDSVQLCGNLSGRQQQMLFMIIVIQPLHESNVHFLAVSSVIEACFMVN